MIINIGKQDGQDVFFDRSKSSNGHILILGETGSGKTVQTQKLMLEIVKNGGTVIVCDIDNIFAESQIHSAYKTQFKEKLQEIDVYHDGISIPLFDPITFSDGEKEKLVDVVDFLADTFANTYRFGFKQKAELKAAIEKVAYTDKPEKSYVSKGISAIEICLNELNTDKAIEVKDRISQITRHNIFRNGDFFIKYGKINMLRLSKFADTTQKAVMEILSNILWKYAYNELFNEEVYILFDECQNMDMSKEGMIAKILEGGRKHHLNLLLSTQVFSRDTHISKLITQSSLRIHFRPPVSEIETIAKLIGRRDYRRWINFLDDLIIGEFIACGKFTIGDKDITDPLIVSARIE